MNAQASSDVDARLRLLIEQMDEHAVILIDDDGRVRWWSPGAEAIFATSTGDIVGRPLAQLFVPEDVALGIPSNELAVASTSKSAEDDRWLRRGDGSRFWASGVTVALRGARGERAGYGKIVRNRTDLKEQLELLRNRVAELHATSERKDLFIATLAHELRGPLAPLQNAAELIRLSSKASPALEQPLRVIDRQVRALARLIDDLFDAARIGAGKVELHTERVALHEVVNGAVEMCTPLVVEHGHRLEVLAPPGAIFVDGDAGRLQQVFVNLVTNAARYTPDGGQIWVDTDTEGEDAVVHVRDNGIGIDADVLPRIFELFTQAGSSQSHEGLGIGLALVKELVELHGGSVQVRSEGRGKGAVFSVRLPLSGTRPSAAGS